MLEGTVLRRWKNKVPDLQYWMIHYLDGNILIDLYCSKPLESALLNEIKADLNQTHHIDQVRLFVIY